nr:hypothetical protein [Mycobacterium tuberculosis]
MFGYAATAATATEALLPFEDAPLITNPGGLLEQAVAVEEAIDTAAANQLMNNVPQALQQQERRRFPYFLPLQCRSTGSANSRWRQRRY